MSQASLWSQQAAPALPTPEYAEAGEAEGIPEYPPGYSPIDYVYKGEQFIDPGPDYSIDQVRQALAETYPELRNATWTERTLADGRRQVEFHKVAGEKG
jgi:PRTRC genetic system protein C